MSRATPSSSSVTPHTSEVSADTRQRIIDAATPVFAELGFHATTVREICTAAGVNVAAINYHFGGKEELYADVLRNALNSARERHPLLPDPSLPAEQRLRVFVRSFLRRILDRGPAAYYGKLMTHEMIAPTKALDTIVESTTKPNWKILADIIADLLGPGAPAKDVHDLVVSLVGPCLMHKHSRAFMERMFPEENLGPDGIDEQAERICRIALAAAVEMRRALMMERGLK
jgi:TetR/AcrR family transcriptional regulator, regulator of cefoperazone and chloramphenicol sensitivity